MFDENLYMCGKYLCISFDKFVTRDKNDKTPDDAILTCHTHLPDRVSKTESEHDFHLLPNNVSCDVRLRLSIVRQPPNVSGF